MWRRAGLLLCEDEKPAISPSLRVRINPLKTSQILARCSATLGLTTGGNYTFGFLFSHQTTHRPGREHTHALYKTFGVIVAVLLSLHRSDTQQLGKKMAPWWETRRLTMVYYSLTGCTVRLSGNNATQRRVERLAFTSPSVLGLFFRFLPAN